MAARDGCELRFGRMSAQIYTLSCPSTGEVRYVGRTRRSLVTRLREHVRRAQGGTSDVAAWIRSLDGAEPIIASAETFTWTTEADADERERRWIAHHADTALNVSDGGLSSGERFRRLVSEQQTERFADPAEREAQAERLRAFYADPKNRKAITERNREIAAQPGTSDKRRKAAQSITPDQRREIGRKNSMKYPCPDCGREYTNSWLKRHECTKVVI